MKLSGREKNEIDDNEFAACTVTTEDYSKKLIGVDYSVNNFEAITICLQVVYNATIKTTSSLHIQI